MRASVPILFLLLCCISSCNISLEVQTPAAPKVSSVLVTTAAPGMAVTRTASPTPTVTLTIQPINAIRSTNCSPRTDWAVYIVAAGDTLGSIARRTGTTVNLLAEANCLADANQIMAGQQLRIPYNSLDVPTPVGPPTSVSRNVELVCPFATIWFGCPMTQQTTNLIYQPFDRGYMFARRDTRKVYVLYADTQQWEQFEDTWQGEPIYPSMPEDGSIPCGSSFRPYGALGKVWWSNNPILPTRLGCGTSAQVEYMTPWEEHRGWAAGDTPITINVFHWPTGDNLVLDPSSGWALPPN